MKNQFNLLCTGMQICQSPKNTINTATVSYNFVHTRRNLAIRKQSHICTQENVARTCGGGTVNGCCCQVSLTSHVHAHLIPKWPPFTVFFCLLAN